MICVKYNNLLKKKSIVEPVSPSVRQVNRTIDTKVYRVDVWSSYDNIESDFQMRKKNILL
jgi:hypothetical protein